MKTPSRLPSLAAALILATLVGCVESGEPTGATSVGTRVVNTEVNSSAGASAATAPNGVPDGIARISGQLFYVKAGRGTQITGAQKFSEGLTAQRNGTVLLGDGRLVKLSEGQMVTMGGELRDAPPNIELPSPR